MPLKGEAKRRQQAKWRARQAPAYSAWLYARRKLRFENADAFRLAIEEALLLSNAAAIHELLREAIEGADEKEVEVGNRFDHVKNRPYYQDEGMMLG